MPFRDENTMSGETENTGQTDDKISTDKGVSAQASPIIPGDNSYRAIEVAIQGRFNELRREYLADRETSINRWFAVGALLLTIGGFVGWSRLSDIEDKTRTHLEAIEETRTKVEQAEKDIQSTTAKIAADHPEKTDQAVESVRENPEASLITKAIASAVLLQRLGKIDEAIEKWRAVAHVAEDSDNDQAARAWLSIGYLLKEKAPEDSLSAYGRAIRLKPDFAEAYTGRGITKDLLGRHEDALADLDQAIRLKPDYANAYYNRGRAKGQLGDNDKARAEFETALALAQTAGNTNLEAQVKQSLRALNVSPLRPR